MIEKLKRPAFQFYPGEWISDLALKSCSLTARGLWIEMLCLMHQAEPYGHLQVNGAPMQPAQLAAMVGAPLPVVRKSLAELEAAAAFSRTTDGVIYSRRMVRDERLRQQRAEWGKAGGEHGVKGREHGAKGGRPRKAEEPGGRGDKKPPLKPPPSSSSSSSVSSLRSETTTRLPAGVPDAENPPASGDPLLPPAKRIPDCPAKAVVDLYHELLPELPKVERLTEARRGHIRARWREWAVEKGWQTAADGLAEWRRFFAWVRKSDFVMGRAKPQPGRPPFVADLDFLMAPASHTKLFEGKYHGQA